MSCLTPRITKFVLVCGVLTFQAATAADDMTVNRLLASQCSQCHGTDGHPVGDIDSLAGGNEISGELNEMRNKSNPDDIMEHQAMGYTSDQIRRIAAYYATVSRNGGSNTGGGINTGGSGGDNTGGSGGDNTGGSGGDNTGGSGGDNTGGSGGDNTGGSDGNNSGDSHGHNSGGSDGHNSGDSKDSSDHKRSRDREKSRKKESSRRNRSRDSD